MPTPKAQTCHEAVAANPERERLLDQCSAAHREAERLRTARNGKLREIQSLLLVADLCRKHSWQESTTEQDQTLEQFTGEDGECWGWNFNKAAETCLAQAAAIAGEVCSLNSEAKAAEDKAQAISAKREELEVVIRRQWHAEREATEAA